MDNYLDSLNPSQRAAVEYCDGPQLVIAGAGSGKTRVLTIKIAHLLRNGYRPNDIIALTFTKKAATEMQNRINQLVPGAARSLWMGTFHSLFSRILRREATRLGFPSDFTIYDQSDSLTLIKQIIKEFGLDNDTNYKPSVVQSRISKAKCEQNISSLGLDIKTIEIYRVYRNRCKQANAMDFDDLLLYTYKLFNDFPNVLEMYQNYFRYILVDEYQDTNNLQNIIIEMLSRKHRHVCVVGDDAQSIYSFRGAKIGNILKFQNQFSGTKLFKLEQNYRSTQNIVDAANSLIAKNIGQIPKKVFSQNERGSRLKLTGSYSDIEESSKIAKEINNLHENGEKFKDCAILYRTNSMSRTYEESLRKAGINYQIYGGLSFYQRKEIKDVLAYLHLIINPTEEISFKRVINYPSRKIGDKTIVKISETAKNERISLYEVCINPTKYNVPIDNGTQKKLMDFVLLIQHFRTLNESLDALEITRKVIIESGIYNHLLEDRSIEGISRQENVQELLNAIANFVKTCEETGNNNNKLIDFLADVSLSGAVEPSEEENKDNDCVAMMTIHQAKGLEFKNVFIVGIEQKILPNERALKEPNGIEEERRLFYVAITRAEKRCYLSYSLSRFINGRSEPSVPSRFIKDIDRQFIEQESAAPAASRYDNGGAFASNRSPMDGMYGNWGTRKSEPSPRPSVLDFSKPKKVAERKEGSLPSTASLTYGGKQLTAGTRIAHERFGVGVITSLSGEGGDARISVRFENMGEKTLLLKFAKFTLV